MDRKEQYDEAVRLAKELKRERDAEIGDWFNEPKFILLHEYKNNTSPQTWLDATGHRSPWVEEPSETEEEIDWEEVLGSEEAVAREEESKDLEKQREKELKQLKDSWDKNFGAYSLLEEWIPRSENHRFWWDGLEVAAAYALRKREVPDPLADWLADVLEGKRPKPKKGAGYYAGRDFLLAEMVQTVCDQVGIQPTRNKAKKPTYNDDLHRHSACDAVGDVVGLSYEAIEAVWFNYGFDPFLRRRIRTYGGTP